MRRDLAWVVSPHKIDVDVIPQVVRLDHVSKAALVGFSLSDLGY